MIRYRYNEDVTPPAPFVHVKVRAPDGGTELGWLPAQLDSAASRTVLPLRLVQEVGLVPVDEIPIMGVGGHVMALPAFLAQIELRQLVPLTLVVVAHEDEPFVLLGRDVINHYRILLDGPAKALEME